MDLHGQIMNLVAVEPNNYADGPVRDAYRIGHYEARHAAAELALKADALIESVRDVMAHLHDTSTTGYIRDNDKSRDALRKMKQALAAIDATNGVKMQDDYPFEQAELDALRKDAARYRWLADNSDGDAQNDFIRWLNANLVGRIDLDAAIDAAMGQP